MQFNYWDLKRQRKGATVKVTLSGNAANVMLLDSSNFSAYKRRARFQYFGGHAKRSPVLLPVPHDGHWYLVVDFGGLRSRARIGVEVLPGPLPAIRSATPSLDGIAEAALAADSTPADERDFDVFVSHASEDKDAIVRPLAHALAAHGLEVWYDEFELRIGDSLRRKIDYGLANSRFGVVIISQHFLAKNWAQYELDGLVTREMAGGQQVILPVWHEISKEQIIRWSPSLADKLALRTTDATVDEIAHEIASVVGGEEARSAA